MVDHNVENTSDHDPIFISFTRGTEFIGLFKRIFNSRLSWAMASDNDLNKYHANLSQSLNKIYIPYSALLCNDMKRVYFDHFAAINQYINDISNVCLMAGDVCISQTTNRKNTGRIPGWSEEVKPLRDNSLFWHNIWIDCGRPRVGHIADCMRRTRASYHYAIRRVKKNEEQIIRNRIATSLLHDPNRNFWSEIRKIRNKRPANCRIVDGCKFTDEESVAQLFASKYAELFSSVSYNNQQMQNIIHSVESHILPDMYQDCVTSCSDVRSAISRLKSHKNDGDGKLSTDHFHNTGVDLSVHVGLLFSAITSHGTVATDFATSTILPIPKIKNVSAISNDNFRGIALSSIFVKLFENIIMYKYADKLHTSELQFGFKKNSSTHMCTMVLKETLSYYTTHNSHVFCTF